VKPADETPVLDLPGLSTACLGVLCNRGITTVGQLRMATEKDLIRMPGIGPTFRRQIAAALDGTGAIVDHTPAQLRALATITEITGHPASRWRVVHQPPDMVWVDYVDEAGVVGQCCRSGDGWRQAPTGKAPVFLVYSPPPVRR
jgi:hypothetical protein